MTKSLYLPEHIAQKLKSQQAAKFRPPEKPAETDLEKAYVDPTQRVLDPALLDTPLLERLPQPTGWRVLVMPYQTSAKTKGGVHIPDEVRARETVATVVAYVLRVGPLAYKDPGKFGPECTPWCKQGDWVCIGRYAGSRFKIDGGEVRILNDDEIIATILDPTDVFSV
jgi:co-chaperonin GroES (HSP10)